MDLRKFDVYQYLKEKYAYQNSAPYFLADENTYQTESIRFPIRTFSYGIGLTYTEDDSRIKIGSVDYQLSIGSLITIGPGIISQWLGDCKARHNTIYFTEELFQNTHGTSFFKNLFFFLPGGNHMIVLNEEQIYQMKLLFDVIKQFIDEKKIIPGLIHSLIMLTIQCHQLYSKGILATSGKEKISRDFCVLLSQYLPDRKEVSFYAEKLNLTPKYLSEVLQEVQGKSAKTMINEQIFMEAKSLLRQTHMTVQEIAHWFGYYDTSYFIKVFKRNEGMTPIEYKLLP